MKLFCIAALCGLACATAPRRNSMMLVSAACDGSAKALSFRARVEGDLRKASASGFAGKEVLLPAAAADCKEDCALELARKQGAAYFAFVDTCFSEGFRHVEARIYRTSDGDLAGRREWSAYHAEEAAEDRSEYDRELSAALEQFFADWKPPAADWTATH